ncbi:MAG: ComF family protein [Bacteroidia bacterium]|nr:ComF family protein [Bacteroidia bacterium]NNF30405.1 ComF family protein [Flavobacteriaceae bacterium]MBT8275701.1 ComF family protein [Bacteroidia bacterium]NNJ82317.1 ComF family protein [Flavobacteriaceae bacterium]NNK54712.1 ComF family protein [Flavobacteriaceae bacterium]
MLNLLFPKICHGCEDILQSTENVLCTQCRHDLPLTRFHLHGSEGMKRVFYGLIPVENATALLHFQKKGITQQLLHNLKYRGQEEIGAFLGDWLGAELAENPKYVSIDLVIPVPIHNRKRRKRGYNQVTGFGKQIASALGAEFREDILLKVSKTSSQVLKKRLTRFQDEQIFRLQERNLLRDKHVLLVDDIVTTGATLENCARQLLDKTNARLSVATMAIA